MNRILSILFKAYRRAQALAIDLFFIYPRLPYLLATYPRNEIKQLCFVGASGRQPALVALLRKIWGVKSIGFEPNGAEAEKLRAKDRFDRIHEVAVAEGAGERTLYITQHPSCSSLYEPDILNINALVKNRKARAAFRVTGQVMVKTDALVNLLNASDLPQYLQIDTQGNDLNVLQCASAILKSVYVIVSEQHFMPLYKEQPLFPEMHDFMTQNGFILYKVLGNNTKNFGGNLVEANVCYVNQAKEQDSPRAVAWLKKYFDVHFA